MAERISDADAERSAAALVEMFRNPSPGSDVEQIIGPESTAAYGRLAEFFIPALVRWQASEVNRGTTVANRTLAMAAFCGWLLANDARNADPGNEVGSDISVAAFGLLRDVAMLYGRLLVGGAALVPESELSRTQPRTS